MDRATALRQSHPADFPGAAAVAAVADAPATESIAAPTADLTAVLTAEA